MEKSSDSATDYLSSKINSLRVNQITHYTSCEKYLQRYRVAGLVLVLVFTSTLSLGFTFLNTDLFYGMNWIVPALSIIVAALSALLTFAGDQAKAMDHQASAIAYGALLRQCEVRVSGAFTEKDNNEFLPQFLKEWSSISSTSPLTKKKDRLNIENSILLEGENER